MLTLLLVFCRILSGLELLFVGSVLITASVSLLVIGLFTFSIFPGSLLGDGTYLRICSFLLGCPFYWHTMNRRFSNK